MSVPTPKTAVPALPRLERVGVMLARIVENAAVCMVLSEMDGSMVYANRAFAALLGHRIGADRRQNILDIIHPQDTATARLQLRRLMHGEAEDYRGEHRFCRVDGAPLWVMVAASLVRDDVSGEPVYLITQLTDIELQKAAEAALAHSATHDDLTGLPNRAAFERALNGAIATASDGRGHCLLYVDLDRFKQVNDNAGHAAGDALLRQAAQTIRGSCRGHDVVARIGGDEFAVLLDDCLIDGGLRIAEKIVRAIGAQAFSWTGRTYQIGASIGLTLISEKSSSPLGFMGEADAACYAAKARGRGIAVAFRDL